MVTCVVKIAGWRDLPAGDPESWRYFQRLQVNSLYRSLFLESG